MPVTVSYTATQGLLQALFQLLGKAVQSDLVRQIEYLGWKTASYAVG